MACYSNVVYCYLNFSLLFLLMRQSFAVVNTDNIQNIEQFKFCVRQAKHPNLRECIGRSALNFLQRVEEQDNFTLSEGFVTAKDDNIAGRSLVNFLDTDPVDFRGIMENAGAVFSQRSMEFHMDALYPGLMFKIGPSADAKSLAEFVLDPSVNERNYDYDDDPSTARVLAKQYLVPFLLGLKFNLVALVPLLFAFICLLLKKSLFLAKLAIYVSSVLGIGGALGSLGSIGGFGGLGSIFGGVGGFSNAHAHAHAHLASTHHGLGDFATGGYFPGKTSVYNTYDDDELHHNSPYKRTDRKLNPVMPREFSSTSAPVNDHFYDYEKLVSPVKDRSGNKLRVARAGNLGPSATFAIEAEEEAKFTQNFMTNDRSGWKAIEGRP